MNVAIILAGGTGVRLGGDIPKQYIKVAEKPIIAYALDKFENCKAIDKIIIVCAQEWEEYINKYVGPKFCGYAEAGSSRQHSILNGLLFGVELGLSDEDKVIIHDAARPNVTEKMLEECIQALDEADGVMPVLPVKDTVYYSENGKRIDSLLNRDCIYAGQAPEGFRFGKYLEVNRLSEEELALVRGSSELPFKNGMRVDMISGDEHNYKITTKADLEKFQLEVLG